jgi:hypothetical protein
MTAFTLRIVARAPLLHQAHISLVWFPGIVGRLKRVKVVAIYDTKEVLHCSILQTRDVRPECLTNSVLSRREVPT